MAVGDNTRGSGRGTGRGRGRGRATPSQPVASIALATMAHKPPQSTQVNNSTSSRHNPPSPLDLLNIPINSTTQNQSTYHTPSQSPSQGDVASVGTHQVLSHVDSNPETESSEDDGRVWICPAPGHSFEPIEAVREITKIIKQKFECSWKNYGDVKKKDDAMYNMWFDEFKRKYKWLPEHDAAIKKSYDHKASEGYSNAMYRVRRKIDKGTWIPQKYRVELEQKWAEEDWIDKAKKNSINRTTSDGSLHTGGSIPTTEHYKRLKNSSDVPPTCWDLFERTHKMKGQNSKWVSSKSEKIANEYANRILDRDSQEAIGENLSSEQSDNKIFLEVVGVNKKKRIPGLGPVGENFLPSSSKPSIGISESEILQLKSEHMEMKTVCSNLTAENQSLKEQLSGLYVTQEKMLKFMETFSQSHPTPPLPPRPLANEEGEQFG